MNPLALSKYPTLSVLSLLKDARLERRLNDSLEVDSRVNDDDDVFTISRQQLQHDVRIVIDTTDSAGHKTLSNQKSCNITIPSNDTQSTVTANSSGVASSQLSPESLNISKYRAKVLPPDVTTKSSTPAEMRSSLPVVKSFSSFDMSAHSPLDCDVSLLRVKGRQSGVLVRSPLMLARVHHSEQLSGSRDTVDNRDTLSSVETRNIERELQTSELRTLDLTGKNKTILDDKSVTPNKVVPDLIPTTDMKYSSDNSLQWAESGEMQPKEENATEVQKVNRTNETNQEMQNASVSQITGQSSVRTKPQVGLTSHPVKHDSAKTSAQIRPESSCSSAQVKETIEERRISAGQDKENVQSSRRSFPTKRELESVSINEITSKPALQVKSITNTAEVTEPSVQFVVQLKPQHRLHSISANQTDAQPVSTRLLEVAVQSVPIEEEKRTESIQINQSVQARAKQETRRTTVSNTQIESVQMMPKVGEVTRLRSSRSKEDILSTKDTEEQPMQKSIESQSPPVNHSSPTTPQQHKISSPITQQQQQPHKLTPTTSQAPRIPPTVKPKTKPAVAQRSSVVGVRRWASSATERPAIVERPALDQSLQPGFRSSTLERGSQARYGQTMDRAEPVRSITLERSSPVKSMTLDRASPGRVLGQTMTLERASPARVLGQTMTLDRASPGRVSGQTMTLERASPGRVLGHSFNSRSPVGEAARSLPTTSTVKTTATVVRGASGAAALAKANESSRRSPFSANTSVSGSQVAARAPSTGLQASTHSAASVLSAGQQASTHSAASVLPAGLQASTHSDAGQQGRSDQRPQTPAKVLPTRTSLISSRLQNPDDFYEIHF